MADARYSSDMMRQVLPEGRRHERIVAALREVSVASGRPRAQGAFAWLRTREIPVIHIIGARRLSQLEDNLASLSLTLAYGQVTALDEGSSIELDFPHDFHRREMVRTSFMEARANSFWRRWSAPALSSQSISP